LKDLGYVSSYYNSSVYTLINAKEKSIIWVHVDDGIVTGSSDTALKQMETHLKGSLEIEWHKGLTSMVGVNIQRSVARFELTQLTLISKILKERWDGNSITSTPLPEGFSASLDDNAKGINPSEYFSTIGSLSYVAVGTRPDIAYSVNYLAHFSSKPTNKHWKGLQHLVSYLAGSRTTSLKIHPTKDTGNQPVQCFCNANWGGTKSQSTYRVLIRLNGCPIMWVLRRLTTVASLTCQAKYMALGHTNRHCL
jgi:hypothetical protein